MAFELNLFNEGQVSPQFLAEINMEQAVQAAEKRVQEEADKTFKTMQEALRQSQANNRTLAERNVLMANEIEMLRQQLKGLQERADVEKQEQERLAKAYQARFSDLATNVSAICTQIIKDAQDDIKEAEAVITSSAGHVSPYTMNVYIKQKNIRVGKRNKLIEQGTGVQNQMVQFENSYKKN